MYEIHGWVCVQYTYKCAEEFDESTEEYMIRKIKENVKLLDWPDEYLSLRAMNGSYHINISAFINHKGNYEREILSLFDTIEPAPI